MFQYKYFSICLILMLAFTGCKEKKSSSSKGVRNSDVELVDIEYAKGFTISKNSQYTSIDVLGPWPNSEESFKYVLIPKGANAPQIDYDALIEVPIDKIVVTSTTHIPALEALNEIDKLVGFPDTKYVSSEAARKRIDNGEIIELGMNESINTEILIDMKPDVVVGFSINSQNKTYDAIQRSGISVAYNGDWAEETPLGKAEWIKFFAPFFGKEKLADSIFNSIEKEYQRVKDIAKKSKSRPTVFSGAMFKDVWYMPTGESWAGQFLKDANANYLWKETKGTGSLALNFESVLEKAKNADIWLGSSQFTSYAELDDSNPHYSLFDAYKNKNIYTFSLTKGATGGILYYELAPNRPDVVLKDIIHILHPELLPNHKLFFFKPLE
ncbi:iron complex transport system substrate-binding protein [Zhouia amylolytica]|uniref:Iron complex transport system substrate-binding protein n=1 Tax=Zhouia amylolytica TaxID=376730 RepID=A0A1I6QJK9_9FLAO|nr:ABC transporter substrate-binding protein [Zhouia amylolytica]MCQ0111236.1 ABC transporter substrate-binding protein [Zhouia amylolytica]SFS52565.1 iron complex transport system substrate-binding protein [Zhouia amylolytica]